MTKFELAQRFQQEFQELIGEERAKLKAEIVSKDILPSEEFGQHSPEVTVQESGKVAVHGPHKGYAYVLAENLYQQGIAKLK